MLEGVGGYLRILEDVGWPPYHDTTIPNNVES